MTLDEANILRNANNSAWNETSYWLGNSADSSYVYVVFEDNENIMNINYDLGLVYGVRPIIVIE